MERKEDLLNSTWLDLCIFSAKAFLTTRRLFRASPPIPSLPKSPKFHEGQQICIWKIILTGIPPSMWTRTSHACAIRCRRFRCIALTWCVSPFSTKYSSKSQKFIIYWKFIRTSNHRDFSEIQDFYSPLIFNTEILLSNLRLFSVCQRIAEDSNLVDRCLNIWNGEKSSEGNGATHNFSRVCTVLYRLMND